MLALSPVGEVPDLPLALSCGSTHVPFRALLEPGDSSGGRLGLPYKSYVRPIWRVLQRDRIGRVSWFGTLTCVPVLIVPCGFVRVAGIRKIPPGTPRCTGGLAAELLTAKAAAAELDRSRGSRANTH